MLGMHGTYTANMAISEADVIVAIGVRFDDRVTGALEKFAPKAAIIHASSRRFSASRSWRRTLRRCCAAWNRRISSGVSGTMGAISIGRPLRSTATNVR